MAFATDRRRGLLAVVVAALGCAAIGYLLGDGYIARLSNHDGYYLVPVEEEVRARPASRPRRTVVVVVDGLRGDAAAAMRSTRRLEQHGSCVDSSVGALTVSRPVYSVISGGIEVDRSGVRNNDETRPAPIDSIWESARRAGLRVTAASDVPYWRQLFPRGFDRYVLEETREQNIFELAELADLSLIHASYPDAAGHDVGAAAAPYREAVERTDRELLGLLDRLDLERDLVVMTADHGHVALGGHGGPAREIRVVKTCLAGPGVDRDGPARVIDHRVIAPTLAVLLGLEFPRHMRAVEDSLDRIWDLVDERALGAGYVAERVAGIERFRRGNRRALATWGAEGRWSTLYRDGRRWQLALAAAAGALIAVLWTALLYRRSRRWTEVVATLGWMAAILVVAAGLYAWRRDSFDFTSINRRLTFIYTSLAATLFATALASVVHLRWWRDLRRLAVDLLLLALALLMAMLAHRLIYGVPVGFPLPGRIEIFLPFIGAAYLIAIGGSAALAAITAMVLSGRRGSAPR